MLLYLALTGNIGQGIAGAITGTTPPPEIVGPAESCENQDRRTRRSLRKCRKHLEQCEIDFEDMVDGDDEFSDELDDE